MFILGRKKWLFLGNLLDHDNHDSNDHNHDGLPANSHPISIIIKMIMIIWSQSRWSRSFLGNLLDHDNYDNHDRVPGNLLDHRHQPLHLQLQPQRWSRCIWIGKYMIINGQWFWGCSWVLMTMVMISLIRLAWPIQWTVHWWSSALMEKGALPNPCKYHWMKMMTIFNQINNNISYPACIRSNPGAQPSLTRTKKRNPFS